ncbi:hypothetical protein DEJ50_31625 [Streptomyces venezuelae]|uniref:Uncharacterized protein n=2 Tax=Streptomyces venezuelae TaxID=54571 RepID=A0A5P2D9H1_STRVZ|nr:hypothetical protein DEJ50_31625 [Streptomyces venezuelae]
MPLEEKRAWSMGLVTMAAYLGYLAAVLGRTDGDAGFTQLPYISPMLSSIGAAIGASILIHIVLDLTSGERGQKTDQRDREIGRFGEHAGQAFVVIGAVAALVMAMAEVDHFWIANAVYLAFALSAVLGSAARIFAYRRGFQPW